MSNLTSTLTLQLVDDGLQAKARADAEAIKKLGASAADIKKLAATNPQIAKTVQHLDALAARGAKLDAFRASARNLKELGQGMRLARADVAATAAALAKAEGKGVKTAERAHKAALRRNEVATEAWRDQARAHRDLRQEVVASGVGMGGRGANGGRTLAIGEAMRTVATQAEQANAHLREQVRLVTQAGQAAQGAVTRTAAVQRRAGPTLLGGMGAAGRAQLGDIEARRRIAAGMGGAGRPSREAVDRGDLRQRAAREVEPRRRDRGGAERTLGPLADAFGAYEAAAVYRDAAAFDRRITMIGQTADASRAEIDGLSASVHSLAQQTATPVDKLAGGLEALVAQGRNLRDSLGFLPSVARTAAASGSEVDDIAKTADSVGTNFEIAGRQMQKAFDIMAAGGKAGQFELKDMARYLPSLGPAASAIGFKGEKGLADIVAMLQVMRKGSGTAEEAVSSMNNILAKMESDKTTKALKTLGVDAEDAFKKARKEGRNLVEVFEELVNKALKGDRSRLGEIIDDMEFKRGVQALMSYRGEWQKLSQTLRETSGGTVARDLVQVTRDAQAGVDRLGNAWKRFTQAGARLSDAGGVSSGLGAIGQELETVAQTLERINRAYGEGGFFDALRQGVGDGADRLKENRKAWLDHFGKTEDGRIGELEVARDAHRKKLEAEGRSPAEIAGAMKIRDREIARARGRKAAVQAARGAPDLADKVPLRMGVDPTAPIQGQPGQVGPGIAGFQQAYPLDISGRKPLPARTPLPPPRPTGMISQSGGDDLKEILGTTEKLKATTIAPKIEVTGADAAKQQLGEVKAKGDELSALQISLPVQVAGAGTAIAQLERIIALAAQANSAIASVNAFGGRLQARSGRSFSDGVTPGRGAE